MHHQQGRLGISLTMECIIPVNQAQSMLCLAVAVTTRFDKSGYWCLDKILWRKNCLHGRCRSHVSLTPGSRGSAVIFKISVVGDTDIDIDTEPRDYVMWAYVFSATSSGSCSNYALRRTAVENEPVFGEEAANALHHNFYVAGLLKFIEDLD